LPPINNEKIGNVRKNFSGEGIEHQKRKHEIGHWTHRHEDDDRNFYLWGTIRAFRANSTIC
jgi:hypothetical protein